jgi:signal transduction histidine kinase
MSFVGETCSLPDAPAKVGTPHAARLAHPVSRIVGTHPPILCYFHIVAKPAWLTPPISLLVILRLLTLVSVSALGWLGWRLISQDRIVEAQRARERLEQSADRIAANLRRRLETAGELQGLLLTMTKDSFSVAPPGRLLYYPQAAPEPEAPGDAFREGETYEFRDRQPLLAIAFYERLARADDAAVRAGALLRLGRVLRKTGRKDQSLAAYQRLEAIPGVRVAGAPAELVARHEICVLRGRQEDAEDLLTGLREARWQLRRGQFEFYWDEASRFAGRHDPPDAARVALAEAATTARDLAAGAHDSEQVAHASGIPILLVWRGPPGHRTVLLATVDSVLRQIAAGEDVYCEALDGDGRHLAGRHDGQGRAVLRGAAGFHIPWTLALTARPGSADAAMLARQRALQTTIGLMMLFLLSGTLFIARAIRRERYVSRLQSDFVSAVSHEFRSPLTSMRQLSEILAEGRVPSEERRQLYYETLVSETNRLERLVETLLNFGRMEARAHKYKFKELDAGQLADHAAAAFELEMRHARHIERAGQGDCWIRADDEALAVALRNLLDNAVKYSPPGARVGVEWTRTGTQVAIQVRDQGVGVPDHERKSIFQKFVRGSAAADLNVKGTGVGLAMVHQIVAAHGGKIRLESEPGTGSRFTILLPAVERT